MKSSFYAAVEKRLANRRGATAAVGTELPIPPDVRAQMPAEGYTAEQIETAIQPRLMQARANKVGPEAERMGYEQPPKAQPVNLEEDPDRMARLFQKATGTAFDPKSSMDKKAMEEITGVIGELRAAGQDLTGMNDTDIALQWYRSKSYGSKTGRKPTKK